LELGASIPRLHLRASTEADDAACGEIVGRGAGSSIMARRVPFAAAHLTDGSPLPIERTHERIVAVHEAVEDGSTERIVGLAQFCRADRYLWYLFIDPTAQGTGVGSALLAAVEETMGFPLRLRTLAVNERALKFYLRRGFKIHSGWVEDGWHGGSVVWLELEKRKNPRPGPAGRFE
jgi:GNAT superfamily N-acetyltransferase